MKDVPTYCVVEESDGELLGVTTFPNTILGYDDAHELFLQCVCENFGSEEEPTPEELDEILTGSFENNEVGAEGTWSDLDGHYTVMLVKSSRLRS